MRDEDDFSAYALARWPSLVRVLVLLGTPPEDARALAYATLGRLRTDWRHRDELGDLDDHTARTLLAALYQRDRPIDWPSDRPSADRQAVVVWSLLGVGPPAAPADEDEVRRAAEVVDVEPLDLEQVAAVERAQRRARRRRTTRVVAAVLAVLAVVVGGWTWWATRPGPPPALPDAPVERVDNPVGVGWYAGDTLHLDRVALTVEGLRSFAQVRQGAVYADTEGEIVLVEIDGERTRLGTQDPGGAFAASDQDGLVAWVDVSGAPELRVYDLAEDEVVGAVEVRPAARVLAVDDGVVYVDDGDGVYTFERGGGWNAYARMSTEGLLDAAGDTAVFRLDAGTLLVTHSGSVAGVVLAGVGAQLAPEGDYLLTADGAGGRVRVFDTLGAREIDTGLPQDAQVVAAKLGGRGVATYLVLKDGDDPDDRSESLVGTLELTTCPVLDPGLFTTCTVSRTFPSNVPWALAQ